MIQITGLIKEYSSRVVLDIPELVIKSSERCAIIGANGSGKSTLIRILAGTVKPDSGTVIIPGKMREDAGYLPQSPYAFDISVLKNVMLALDNKANAKALAADALTRVGMERLKHMRGNRLSGGETQRMALARMIIKPRSLLLLDEPTSATDIAATDLIENAISEYLDNSQCTLVFSTHSPGQALRLAERVIVLDEGKIVESGSAEKVLHDPVSDITKRFLRHWRV